MDAVRTALVGYGYAGRTFHAPLIRATRELRLVAVVSSDPARVQTELPDVHIVRTPEEAFGDASIELVVVATPNDTHADLALAALAAGKHVVVDKPMALDAAEAERMAAAARTAERLLSVFHNRRFDADFLTLRHLLAERAVGIPLELESRFDRYRPEVRDRWRERPGPGAGLWADIGPHLADQALQLFGEPRALAARFMRERPGAQVEDRFEVTLEYPELRVHLGATLFASFPAPRFRLRGTRGTWIKRGFDRQEDALRAGEQPDTEQGWGADPLAGELDVDGRRYPVPNERGDYRRYYAEVGRAIRLATANPVPPEEGIAVMRILDRARATAERAAT